MKAPHPCPLDSVIPDGADGTTPARIEPLLGEPSRMDPLREEADRIVALIPPQAQRHVTVLLGDVLNILDNIDVIRPKFYPPCRGYMRFERLRAMHAALIQKPTSRDASNE